jgi:plasmid stabilization system protein ParE
VIRYKLTGPATRDIDEVLDYIAAQSVQTAVLVSTRFEKAFERLVDMPSLGHRREELKDANALVYFVSGYLVIYDPTLSPLHILRVLRGARDLGRVVPRPNP